ncbi:E3 ubiquitin-protein ligase [Nymphaea thermarum]|nr:E3 ubiquitin-protein ligase [Nymphaea thermarum]
MKDRSSKRSGAGFSSLHPANRVQDALEHLASIDPIDLCKEAKLELCRATRDLRSCGRYVQHVLTSCQHATLCAECRQKCDMCPICKTAIPRSGNIFRLRLYDQCLEAGLIPKEHADQFQQRGEKHSTVDVQRLYSLFDVAVENNLVTLICHYITDVCMDESAVSSDPVVAILLDEVVVTEWCKRVFKSILADLHSKYKVEVKEMTRNSTSLLKPMLLLSGLAHVLDTLDASFQGTESPQLEELHHLSENVLRAKQHLEVMVWCIRHQFLEHMPSRYSTISLWRSTFHERRTAAMRRCWPEFMCSDTEAAQPGSTLFIEDALSNLVLEQGHEGSGELEVACLLKDPSSSLSVEEASGIYPFENLRAAIDMLFLRGSSDLLLLYYLFDLYWTIPDGEWRKVIDDYANTFGIGSHSVVESLTFYLLDDDKEAALKEACRLLPEIAGPGTHPKVAQVLLERQMPDAALMVLRCSGHDGLSPLANSVHEATSSVPLHVAVTAVRVRIECGLLTQAFMYQRRHCSRLKEEQVQHKSASVSAKNLERNYYDWKHQMEILVTEMCFLCMRRNLVDRMIELPWNVDEEKCLRKCLLSSALEDLSSNSGSLLVVYYLQRCRYIEAYEVDWILRNLEESMISKSIDKENISKIRTISQWRTGLVEKCVDLLHEVQRQQLKSGSVTDVVSLIHKDTGFSGKNDLFGTPQVSKGLLVASSVPSVIFPPDVTPLSSVKATVPDTYSRLPEASSGTLLDSSGPQASAALYRQSPASGNPSFLSRIGSPALDRASEPRFKCNLDLNLSSSKTRAIDGVPERYNLANDFNLLKDSNRRTSRFSFIFSENPSRHTEKILYAADQNGFGYQPENSLPSLLNGTTPASCYHSPESELPGSDDRASMPSGYTADKDKARFSDSLISGKRLFQVEAVELYDEDVGDAALSSVDRAPRWRSDETSEDEDDPTLTRNTFGTPAATPARERRGRRRSYRAI